MFPVHILSTSSVIASAFSQFAPAAPAFSFFACAFISSLFACASFFLVAAFLSFFFDDILVSFFELNLLNFDAFFCLVASLMLYHVVFSLSIRIMVVLSRHGDRESCHVTSVVTAHVDHVIGFGIFVVFQVSSLYQDAVDLLLSCFRRSESCLFSKRLSKYRVEYCEIMYHQSMLQPVSSFVSSIECVRANTGTRILAPVQH